jgi:DNA-binding MarR family transcriptional regulator
MILPFGGQTGTLKLSCWLLRHLHLIALGDLLVCESGSPSRLVNRLVEADLVKRVPSATNGRMVMLTLTEKGEEMAIRVSAASTALYEFINRTLEGSPSQMA